MSMLSGTEIKKQTSIDSKDGAVGEGALVLGPDRLHGGAVEYVGEHVALAVQDVARGRLLELVAAEHLAIGVPEGREVRARHDVAAVAQLKHQARDGGPRLLRQPQSKRPHELGLGLIPSVHSVDTKELWEASVKKRVCAVANRKTTLEGSDTSGPSVIASCEPTGGLKSGIPAAAIALAVAGAPASTGFPSGGLRLLIVSRVAVKKGRKKERVSQSPNTQKRQKTSLSFMHH